MLTSQSDQARNGEAYRGLLRMARYERKWDALEATCRAIETAPHASLPGLEADLGMERGYRLNAEKKYVDL